LKTIIAGSRNAPNQVSEAVKKSGFQVTEVVSDRCRGPDIHGEEWAGDNQIPVKYFPADWDRYGRSAGYRRNAEMADYAEALIALWDGTSRGTKNMIDLAQKRGLKVYVHLSKTPEKRV
jgi:hypothetical protein